VRRGRSRLGSAEEELVVRRVRLVRVVLFEENSEVCVRTAGANSWLIAVSAS